MFQKRSLLSLTLLISGAIVLFGCPSDDDGDGGLDSSVTDRGPTDTGSDSGVDTGVDTGVADGGAVDTGVDNCAPNEVVDVRGTDVTVDPATMPPLVQGNLTAVRSCLRPGTPMFASDYCLVECVEFLGYQPTLAEVEQLEVAVYPLFDLDTMTPIDADPTYDRVTGVDRDPANRLGIGNIITSPPNSDCASGFQLELGFTGAGPGGGTMTLLAETPYVLRVRSVQTSTPAWVDTYHWDFIRRNDEVPQVAACGINEARIPSTRYTFPVVHRSLIEQAVAGSGAAVPGSANLRDGLGSGYALLEARDCSSGGGLPMTNATLGATPTPIAAVYPGASFDVDRTAMFTAPVAHWLAIGFAEMAATSSAALDVTGAVGITSDGTCTEGFAGARFPVYPDALTIIRFNRENSLR